MKSRLPLILLIFLRASLPVNASDSGIRPWSQNPWYWSYEGEPILLIGGSDDDNLFQWPREQLIPHLNRMRKAGANVIRNTMSDRKDKDFEVYPFRQLDDGNYDLTQWNPEYWNRFRTLLQETAQRKIMVQIEIWDRFDYTDHRSPHWKRHPYNPQNNVNYSFEESGFEATYQDHPGANQQPFFFSAPEQRDNEMVRQYQESFVERLLSESLSFDHVLYCIDNETNGEEAWGQYWARFIKEIAKAQGKTVYVTEMWDAWDLTSEEHKRTFDHPELYDYVDVSQNNHNKGREHWNNFQSVRQYLASRPRPMNTTKTYGADGNKFGHSDQDAVERVWRHILGGAASARFHRPDSGLGLNDKAVACIQALRLVEERVPFFDLEPAMDRLRRSSEETYVAANSKAAVIYFTRGGQAKIQVPGGSGRYRKATIDIDSGELTSEETISAEPILSIEAPAEKNTAVALQSLAPSGSERNSGSNE